VLLISRLQVSLPLSVRSSAAAAEVRNEKAMKGVVLTHCFPRRLRCSQVDCHNYSPYKVMASLITHIIQLLGRCLLRVLTASIFFILSQV
jgi:hypothetical protein